MTIDTETIFGFSPSDKPPKWKYAFIAVLGRVVEGRLRKVANPREEFPNEGNVYVDEQHWIPSPGLSAMWRVRRSQTVSPGERKSEFSAVAKGQSGPSEIVPLLAKSTDHELVRNLLIAGVDLGHQTAGQVLVQTSDDKVFGPIRAEPFFEQRRVGFFCKHEAFQDLFNLWTSDSLLEPLEFQWQGSRRLFSSFVVQPATKDRFDCCDLGDSIKTVLKFAGSLKDHGLQLTKKQIDHLSDLLADDRTPPSVSARTERVVKALRRAVEVGEELDTLSTYLFQSPRVLEEKTRIEHEVRAAAEARVASEANSVKSTVAALQEKERAAREELRKLNGQFAQLERQGSTSVDRLVDQLFEKIGNAAKNPSEALTRIALIRPFLRAPTSNGLQVSEQRVGEDAKTATSLAELLGALEHNLVRVGLVQGAARALAREVTAAASAGQLITMKGSLATQVADACAMPFSGGRMFRTSIPVGLLQADQFATCLSSVSARAPATMVRAWVIEGINRSALDVYGDSLRDFVAERQLGIGGHHTPLVVFGVSTGGPSGLPLMQSTCELGPVFDTDALALVGEPGASLPVSILTLPTTWQSWIPSPEKRAPSQLSELLEYFKAADTALWKRVVQHASDLLSALAQGDNPTPLQSLVFGWLAPFALTLPDGGSAFAAQVSDGMIDVAKADPRIPRVFARAEATDQ